MKDFVLQNWPALVAVLIGVLNVVITILKKRISVVDGIWSKVLEMLPECICHAEIAQYSGPEKKALVCNYVLDYISSAYDLSRKKVVEKYADRVSDAVENILACPQKKGVVTDEK